MKTCPKCNKTVPKSSFWRNKRRRDGLQCYCMFCQREIVKKISQTERSRIMARARVKAYKQTPQGRLQHKQSNHRYYQTEKGKLQKKTCQNIMNHEYRLAHRAHITFFRALKNSKIQKDVCFVCGANTNIEAHHEDYSKPLDVIWLCQKHHREKHLNSSTNYYATSGRIANENL